MAAFHLVVDSLAEVVKKSRALGKRHVHAQLAGKKPCNVGDLDGVVQDVLAIGCAVFLAAEELDDLGMQVVNAGLEACAFTLDLDRVVDLAARLFDHILDAGWMDAAVGDELFKGQARNFAAHRVK